MQSTAHINSAKETVYKPSYCMRPATHITTVLPRHSLLPEHIHPPIHVTHLTRPLHQRPTACLHASTIQPSAIQPFIRRCSWGWRSCKERCNQQSNNRIDEYRTSPLYPCTSQCYHQSKYNQQEAVL